MMLMIMVLLLRLQGASISGLLHPGEDVIVPETVGTEAYFPGQADRDLYILGPGDYISAVVEGGSTEALLGAGVSPWAYYAISGDGYLSLSGVGAACVEGMTLNQAQDTFQQKVSRYYPSLRITLSLAQPRVVRMDIRGMVVEPGTYLMSALSRVSDLVTMAGGISTFGSRFGTMITAEGDTMQVDLHVDPQTGSFKVDPYLDRGTSVIFGECRTPVYVVSYDLSETWDCREGETVRSLMDGMGGVTGDFNLSSSRLHSGGENLPVWTGEEGILDLPLSPGDTLLLVTSRMPVFIGGAVNIPGPLEFIPENTVLDYLLFAGGAKVDADMGGVSLYRQGSEIGTGEEILTIRPQAGDAIEVPYTWISRNSSVLSLLISVSSVVLTFWAITK
jgi:protein involved in polysaccharide export with SLBB domain